MFYGVCLFIFLTFQSVQVMKLLWTFLIIYYGPSHTPSTYTHMLNHILLLSSGILQDGITKMWHFSLCSFLDIAEILSTNKGLPQSCWMWFPPQQIYIHISKHILIAIFHFHRDLFKFLFDKTLVKHFVQVKYSAPVIRKYMSKYINQSSLS